MTKEELVKEVETLKDRIHIQTYRSLLGQIRVGDLKGAETGLARLKWKLRRKEAENANRIR